MVKHQNQTLCILFSLERVHFIRRNSRDHCSGVQERYFPSGITAYQKKKDYTPLLLFMNGKIVLDPWLLNRSRDQVFILPLRLFLSHFDEMSYIFLVFSQ
jgi:hypothetical protein